MIFLEMCKIRSNFAVRKNIMSQNDDEIHTL